MTRKEWMHSRLDSIKEGYALTFRCVMSDPDRIASGFCLGTVSNERINRGQDTCSPECQEDKRRLKREQLRQRKCSHCGHGFTKSERARIAAERLKNFPESGKEGEV
jgi:hypothetical protein